MSFINNVRIKRMVLGILIVFTLLWGSISAFSLYALNNLTREVDLTNVQQLNGDIINGASEAYYRVTLRMSSLIAQGDSGSYGSMNASMMLKAVGDDVAFLKNGLATFKVTDHGNINSKSIEDIYNSSWHLYSDAIVPMMDAVKRNDAVTYQKLFNEKFAPLRQQFSAAIGQYNQTISTLKAEAQLRIQSWVSWSQNMLVIAMVLGIAILIATDRYLARLMGQGLEKVKAHLQRLSKGEMDKTMEELGRNEIGQLIPFVNTMQANWVKTVSEIRHSASEIFQNSSEIASGNTDLSTRTEEQASALSQTAASMEELSAVVKQNADNAQQASVIAKDASVAASQGGEVMKAVNSSMHNITHSSQKIADIISVIDSIAFQTNILALNAAVEAARAGEQGRGFAVVASEVRNLAQRSATAAKEIKTLIDESVVNVRSGSEQVDLASQSMENILKSVTNVTDIMEEIASASSEQSKGITQVGAAITQMDGVTQQNAALVEQSSATSAALEDQANHLKSVVAVFTLPQGGRALTPRPPRPAAALPEVKYLTAGSKPATDNGDWTSF